MRQYVAVAIVLVFLIALAILPRTTLRHAIGTLRPQAGPTSEELARLQVELDVAKAQIAASPTQLFSTPLEGTHRAVPVYASYPFNYQHELFIANGTAEGIAVGDVALFNLDTGTPGLLIGRVTKVSEHSAQVRTIFDPEWRSAVRVGTSSVDALLEGGVTPRLTLLPNDAPLATGDVVFSSDKQFPYGLSLGTVGSVHDVSGGASREALLQTPYDVNTIHAVTIVSHGE